MRLRIVASGLYQIQGSSDLQAGWSPLLHTRHGISLLPSPAPDRAYFRLRFFDVFE